MWRRARPGPTAWPKPKPITRSEVWGSGAGVAGGPSATERVASVEVRPVAESHTPVTDRRSSTSMSTTPSNVSAVGTTVSASLYRVGTTSSGSRNSGSAGGAARVAVAWGSGCSRGAGGVAERVVGPLHAATSARTLMFFTLRAYHGRAAPKRGALTPRGAQGLEIACGMKIARLAADAPLARPRMLAPSLRVH